MQYWSARSALLSFFDDAGLYSTNDIGGNGSAGTFDVPNDIRLPAISHHIKIAGSSGVILSDSFILVPTHVASPGNGWPGTNGGPVYDPLNSFVVFRDHNGVLYEQDSEVYGINRLFPGSTPDLSIVKVRPHNSPPTTSAAFSPGKIASVTRRFVGLNSESTAVHGNSPSTNAAPRTAHQGHRSWFFNAGDHRSHGDGTTAGQGGDSGGGRYVPRGWEWDLAGFSTSGGGGYEVLNETAIAGIESIIGSPLKRASTARPSETKSWTGPSGSSWGTASSWQSGALPQYTAEQGGLSFGDRVGDIVALPSNRRVVVDGPARALQVFGDGSVGSQLQVVEGGDIFTDQLYAGAESGQIGLIEVSAGEVTTGDFYSGFRGQGVVLQSGGQVTAHRVIVGGEDSGTAAESYYGMLGTADTATRPKLDTDVLLNPPRQIARVVFKCFCLPTPN